MAKKNKIDAAIDKTVETVKSAANEVKTSEYVQRGVEKSKGTIINLLILAIVVGVIAIILGLMGAFDSHPATTIYQPITPTYQTPTTTHTSPVNQTKESSATESPSTTTNPSLSNEQIDALEKQNADLEKKLIQQNNEISKPHAEYNGTYLYKTTVADADTYIRNVPSIDGAPLYHCIKGEEIYVLDSTMHGNYISVYCNGYTGYAVKAFLK